MFSDLKVDPLTLWHEDVLGDPAAAAAAVADYLQVEMDADAAVEAPQIEKQSGAGAAEWKARYASSRGAD
jgi:LPS sulfotransferase NodH